MNAERCSRLLTPPPPQDGESARPRGVGHGRSASASVALARRKLGSAAAGLRALVAPASGGVPGKRSWPPAKPAAAASKWVVGVGRALPRRALPSRTRAGESRLEARLRQRDDVREKVRGMVAEAAAAGWQPSTEASQDSAMRYWLEFCEVEEIDFGEFGQLPDDALGVSVGTLRAEDEAFAGFAAYVVQFPRQKNKEFNSGVYAAQCISNVRSWYSAQPGVEPRRPGSSLWGEARFGAGLARVLKGLRKLHPSQQSKRRPVLRQHLMAIKRSLRLEGADAASQLDRVMWAFVVTAWQGVRRSAELLSGKPGREWAAGRVMHRGRVRLETARRDDGGIIDVLHVELPPSKTDVTGEKNFTMLLPIDFEAEVNAGAALIAMLEGAPLAEGVQPEEAALFVNPMTGKKLVYRDAADWLKEKLIEIGERELATGLHSLRLGGATTLASLNASAASMGMFGLWGSDAYLGYVWAGQEHMLDLSLKMGGSSVQLAPAKWSIK